MFPPAEPMRGLSAAELADACSELHQLAGARVLEITPLALLPDAEDLLLVLQHAAGKSFLLVAPGGVRARITTTQARYRADLFARGPQRDQLAKELHAATLTRVLAAEGERRCTLHFATAQGDRRLMVELFGARGLWALLDAEGRILLLSRPVATAVRSLALGAPYAPPPPAEERRSEAASRFAAPVLAAIDACFRPYDEQAELRRSHELLQRGAQRALHKAKAKVQGLAQQLADVGRVEALRNRADLMLAYQHTVRRGAPSMQVPDPLRDGETLTIELDPAKPVLLQAQALYEKARRLDDSRAISTQRLATAETEVAALQQAHDELAQLTLDAEDVAARLAGLRERLQRLGAVPKAKAQARPTAAQGRSKPDPASSETCRRFVSAEGYPIWVGKNNEQNDRLTMRIANGNDLWLHVGGGRPGSHVIVRLPKQKTASLETLLDAATLAVHFSKARSEGRIEVVYTQKKHVRKPKGLPAGAVVPSQTKSITVHADPERLQRLLGSADPADA